MTHSRARRLELATCESRRNTLMCITLSSCASRGCRDGTTRERALACRGVTRMSLFTRQYNRDNTSEPSRRCAHIVICTRAREPNSVPDPNSITPCERTLEITGVSRCAHRLGQRRGRRASRCEISLDERDLVTRSLSLRVTLRVKCFDVRLEADILTLFLFCR